MSNSYYCCVCWKELLEIKNTDSLIDNIEDILLLCEECGKTNRLSLEKNTKIKNNQRIDFCNNTLVSVNFMPLDFKYEIKYIFNDTICTVINDTFTNTVDMAIELMEKSK